MGWRGPLTPPLLSVPRSSCGQGWGWAAVRSEQGCRAPRYLHWGSGSSCPGSPGNPETPGSTERPHPPPQTPVSSLEQHQLWRDLCASWKSICRKYLLPITMYKNVINYKCTKNMVLFSYCTISYLALGRCEQSSSCERVQCVFSHAGILWFYVDFYWYKQTQHATHNVQYVTYMCATGNKFPAWSTLSLGGICNRYTPERFYSDPPPRVKMWISFWKYCQWGEENELTAESKMAHFWHCSLR